MPDFTYDVVIIGSGPAGSSAAIECAKAGLKTAVIEKSQHPRVKVCGGGVVRRAHDLFPVDISSVIEAEVRDIELVWHQSKFALTGECPKPSIYMVMRDKLDALLASDAKDTGVTFYEDNEINTLEHIDDGVIVSNDKHKWTAKWVIAADGTGGNTAKLAGWRKDTRVTIPAVEAEVKLKPEVAKRLNRTRIDFEAIKYGYGWVFPKAEHLSIGVGRFHIIKDKQPPLKQTLKDYYKILGIADDDILSIHQAGFAIPIRHRSDGFCKGHVLLVGDVAGFADPLTAEGISAAVYSGKLAVQAITTGASYDQLIAAKIIPDLKFSALLADWFYFRPKLARQYLQMRPQHSINRLFKVFAGEARFTEVYQRASWWKKQLMHLFGFKNPNAQKSEPSPIK